MNTEKISYAQLNVSKHYTVQSITDLINGFSALGFNSYYNSDTKSIDVESNENEYGSHIIIIKQGLKNWIDSLSVDPETSNVLHDYIDLIFNITTIHTDDGIIIKVYLY